jgi:chromate reductase, NAD(P)H dehydrogenase (quinone)
VSAASRILLICGSLRSGSTNAAVLRTVAAAPGPGVEATLFEGLASLPHFNPDDDNDPLPVPVADLRARIAASDAVLFCTPEYAGTLPGSLKNLLEWTIGGGEIYGKPVAWINVSTGPTGAAGAHDSLRTVLGYAGTRIVEAACAQVPVARHAVAADGLIHDEATRREIAAAVTALAAGAAAPPGADQPSR